MPPLVSRSAPDGVEELGGVGVGDVGSARVDAAGVAEGLPAAAGLLRRAAGDANGNTLVGEQVESGDLLSQVERVLVAHVDDAGADLDAPGTGAGRGEQRDGGGGLAGVVVDAPVGAVDADLVSADGDLDGLLERLAGVGVARAATVSIVSEAEEPECFHATFNDVLRRIIPADRAIQVTPPSCAAHPQRRQRA